MYKLLQTVTCKIVKTVDLRILGEGQILLICNIFPLLFKSGWYSPNKLIAWPRGTQDW